MSDDTVITRLIRPREVARRTGYTTMHIWRLERDGKFPKRVKLSEAGAVAFVEAEIEQWIKSRIRGFGAPVWPRKPKSRERFSAEDLADLDTTTRRPRERL